VHHPQFTAKSKQQDPWPHELSWVQPPLLLGAASCSRCYRTLSATYNPYFQTCCTVYILFHRPHSLEVHFTRRVSKLFDTSNLLQHVGTSTSFYFSGFNSKSSWGGGQEQNMEGLRFSYILFTYAHPVSAS
jgi:hypothetical protein